MLIANDDKINSYLKNNIRLFALYFYSKFTSSASDKIELVFQKDTADILSRRLEKNKSIIAIKIPSW
tara:strand:- start:370 stop:570 length:201 start_codon:yes stop_codon:yes gene_type:complete